ncbi:hypothetical protein ACHAXT_013031 [Thalassiosira profunda]
MQPHRLLPWLLSFLLCSPALSLVATTAAPPKIRLALLPSDLPSIQDCRRSAYAGKPVNLPAAKSFCNADQIQREPYICIIAVDKDGTVLGTADLNTRTKVVNNVYVREEARKRGIAESMMEAVEGEMGAGETLKLTVMSKNIPAVSLYKKLGFSAPGVYGGLDMLSSATPLNFLMEMEKKLE